MIDEAVPTPTLLVRAREVRKTFPPDHHGLRAGTFDVLGGDSVAIVGPSGSGKTTLLSLLGLLERPDGGDLRVLDQPAEAVSFSQASTLRRSGISFIFQSFHLVPHLTVEENVLLGLQYDSAGRAGRLARAREQLDTVGLTDHSRALPNTLSGGEQQRVAIARALVRRPRLLLCDEPTGNLDSRNGEVVIQEILAAVSSTSAVVIVTHDEAIAARCSSRINVRDGFAQGELT